MLACPQLTIISVPVLSSSQQAEDAEKTFLWWSSPFLGITGKAYKLELVIVETEQNSLDMEVVSERMNEQFKSQHNH